MHLDVAAGAAVGADAVAADGIDVAAGDVALRAHDHAAGGVAGRPPAAVDAGEGDGAVGGGQVDRPIERAVAGELSVAKNAVARDHVDGRLVPVHQGPVGEVDVAAVRADGHAAARGALLPVQRHVRTAGGRSRI